MIEYKIVPFSNISSLSSLLSSVESRNEDGEYLEPNLEIRENEDFCLFEGDVHADQFVADSFPHPICILGNLFVKGTLSNSGHHGLFVFGAIKAKNAILGDSFNYIETKLEIENTLLLEYCGETIVDGSLQSDITIWKQDHSCWINDSFIYALEPTERGFYFVEKNEDFNPELLDENNRFNSTELKKQLLIDADYKCISKNSYRKGKPK